MIGVRVEGGPIYDRGEGRRGETVRGEGRRGPIYDRSEGRRRTVARGEG